MNKETTENPDDSTTRPQEAARPSAAAARPNDEFPVVGIGASAGGLDAFMELLKALPQDTGMAYVLIQHLNPQHESRLADLLAKSTELPIQLAADGLAVAPNQAYVIPPDTNMAIVEGRLRLTPRSEGRGQHLPLDFFFRSLADDRQSMAIGVVLSGTGSDGTLGLAEIKAAGGLTFAQDPESARYDGMPKNAAHSGADFVLTPEQIAAELVRIGRHPYLTLPHASGGERPASGQEEPFRKILHLLRQAFGVDFSLYRNTTLRRRIMRRMVLHTHDTLADYTQRLEGDRRELEQLYEDILINVTSFFRDPEMFEELAASVFPEIVKAKTSGTPIRVWTAGCSTGQEAYSLAIALVEFLDDKPGAPEIQIFATDLSDAVSLVKARGGYYPESIEGEVSPERLRRFFFREEDGGYRVVKAIRDLCVFAKQNIAEDPPFSRLDLISCRNVMIYLSAPLQKRIVPTFHYALNPHGFLLLGSSETVGGFSEHFETVDKQHKIYQKKPVAQRVYPHFSSDRYVPRHPTDKESSATPPGPAEWQTEADRVVVGQYAPVGVLVNDRLEVLQFRGRTSQYLEPASGDASFNLLKMAREGLFGELRHGIAEARERKEPVLRAGVHVRGDGEVRRVDLRIIPLHLAHAAETCFLVLFEESQPSGVGDPQAAPRAPAGAARSSASPLRRTFARLFPRAERAGDPAEDSAPTMPAEREEIEQLRRELAATRDHQQTIMEQQEAANEELRSANEEVLSSNEELQSTNEELETAKEELQSLNEELTTVNEQLQNRNVEMSRLNDDMGNFFTSTKIPLLMLGGDLRLRRFTPAAEKAFDLHAADVGRPLGNIKLSVDVPDLEALVLETLDTMQLREKEMQDRKGHWYLLRIHPYRTAENRIEGAVAAFLDIDDLKRSQQRTLEAADYAEAIIGTMRQPLLVLDDELRVQSANASFYRMFAAVPKETEGRRFYELGNGQWNIPELRRLLEQILPGDGSIEDFSVEVDFPAIGPRTMLLNARRLRQRHGKTQLILLAMEDVTSERKLAEQTRADLGAIVESSDDAIVSKGLDGVIRSWNRGAERIFGYSAKEAIGQPITLIVPQELHSEEQEILQSLRRGESIDHYETVRIAKSGQRIDVSLTISPVRDPAGRIVGASKIARDISEMKRKSRALQDADRRKDEFLAMLAHELRNPLSAVSSAVELLGTDGGEAHFEAGRQIISRQTRLLIRLVNDLLDMSRVSRGMVTLRKEAVDATTLVRLAVETVRPLLDARRHNLKVSVGRKPLWLDGDATRLEQVFANLLSNAAKFTEPGGRIEVEAGRQGDTIVVTVRDNGIGMSGELLPHVFELFAQFERSSDRSAGGLGIGLTLVKSITEMHGGSVEAGSDGPGRGSEFTVRLPALAKGDIPDAATRRAAPVANAGPARRVLVVDDNEDAALGLSRLLEVSGHTVEQAYDGPAALDTARTFKPDAILLDIGLPDLDGYEVAKRLRREPALKDALLIAISGYCQEEDRQRSRDAGFDHHLAKPTDHRELLALLAAERPGRV